MDVDVTMQTDNEAKIRQKSIQRLAEIFKVESSTLKDELKMADSFKPNPVKFWKRNQFDEVLDDIRDVADRTVIKQLNSGEIEIVTVRDYVEFMLRCYKDNPKLVELVLGEI